QRLQWLEWRAPSFLPTRPVPIHKREFFPAVPNVLRRDLLLPLQITCRSTAKFAVDPLPLRPPARIAPSNTDPASPCCWRRDKRTPVATPPLCIRSTPKIRSHMLLLRIEVVFPSNDRASSNCHRRFEF